LEKDSPLPPGVEEPDSKSIAERLKLERVRYEIGRKINAICKKVKRKSQKNHDEN